MYIYSVTIFHLCYSNCMFNVESDKNNGSTIISVQNVPFSPISLKPLLNNKSAKEISFTYRDHSARSSTSVDELTSCTYFSTQSLLNNSKSSTECALSRIVYEECERTIRKSFKKKFCKCLLLFLVLFRLLFKIKKFKNFIQK